MAKEGPIFYESTFNTLNFFTHILIDNTKGCRDKKKKKKKKKKRLLFNIWPCVLNSATLRYIAFSAVFCIL